MKKPKLRIPIAKPSQRHKTVKDYDRKLTKKEIDKAMEPILEFIKVLGLEGEIKYPKGIK